MKKLTQEQFLERVTTRLNGPLDLSEFEYISNSTKSKVICPKHGGFQSSPNSLMSGYGCPTCSKISRGLKRRLTTEEFIAQAQGVHGDTYDYSLSTYSTSASKVAITCPKHGVFEQSPSSHLAGRGCPTCWKGRVGDRTRLSTEEFVSRLKKAGYQYDLSRVVYRSMNSPVTLSCDHHGDFEVLAGNALYNGAGCQACAREKAGAASRKPFPQWVDEAASMHKCRYAYLDVTYRGSVAWFTAWCPDHGEFEQVASDHIRGVGCPKCAFSVYDQDSFISAATEKHGGAYNYSKVAYTNATDKVEIICAKHGSFWQAPVYHVSAGHGCPTCGRAGASEAQLEVESFLRRYTPTVRDYRLPGSRRTLDVFLPGLDIAIEYHGLIWHSSKFLDDPRKDYKKHLEAEKTGIRVIHIYEDEWKGRRGVVERTLLSALGKLPRVFARSTTVVSLATAEADRFYEAYHLQGRCLGEVAYGLKDRNGALVACMSFGIARSDRRNTDRSTWELERYAAACTVVGGASKLLKAFERSGLAKTVVSYSDTRAFSGDMYKALGFELDSVSPPDYKYTNGSWKVGRLHKSKFQRKHLSTALAKFDEAKSESENCRDNGWYQIFDCGKKKWVKRL